MDITLKAEIKEVTRGLTRLQKKQIPFALAGALSDVAYNTAKNKKNNHSLPNEAKDKFQGGATPFTQRAFMFKKADKKNLASYVYIADKQDDYLKFQVEGGTRTPKGRSLLVPTRNARLNKYGNLTKGQRNKFFSNTEKFFTGVPKGFQGDQDRAGIWERYGGKKSPKIKMVVSFKDSAKYTPKFNMLKLTEDTVFSPGQFGFTSNFRKRLDFALRTAK